MDSSGIRVSQEELEDKLSNVIIRQTNYTKEEAIEELKKKNYSVKRELLDYYEIDIRQSDKKKSTSQQRFSNIRKILQNT